MRRVALYGIGWVAAATVAVLLAWQGVGLVGRNVTDSHPRALTADEAREALGEGSSPAAGSPDTSPAATAPPAGGGSPAGSGTTSTTAVRPRPTATTRPTTSAPTSPSTTRPGAPSSTPTTSASVVRTYNLVGGSAALRFDPSGSVTVVWANPNPGFRADIDDRDGGGVRVRFDGDAGRSQVEAWWDGGPQDRVEEQGSGGSGRG